MLYLEHIAAAPGCQTTELWMRKFSKVGAALFAYVVLLSKLQGFDGRVGLHVAGEDAAKFYEALDARCGGGLFHPALTGVHGPTPRAEHETSKAYLETREAGATRWLEEYRRA